MFPSTLSATSEADLRKLIEKEVPESLTLEYKQDLEGDKSPMAWREQQRITDAARNAFLEEVAAFANAEGGILILGMAETDGRRRVAKALTPLPNAPELARRLRDMVHGSLDPSGLHFELDAVGLREDGAGVVLVRVPPSLRAPHRVMTNSSIPIRRGDRCERKPSMREIHDITLRRARTAEAQLAAMGSDSEGFESEVSRLGMNNRGVLAVRVIAEPTAGPLSLPRFDLNATELPIERYLSIHLREDGPAQQLRVRRTNARSRTLRGLFRHSEEEDLSHRLYAYQNGRVVGWRNRALGPDLENAPEGHKSVFLDWVTDVVANTVLSAHELRWLAGNPESPYVVSVTVLARDCPLKLSTFGFLGRHFDASTLDRRSVALPVFELGPLEDVDALLTSVATDLFDLGREDWPLPIRLVVPSDLQQRWAGGSE